jgi:hypothetical protein
MVQSPLCLKKQKTKNKNANVMIDPMDESPSYLQHN